MANYSLDCRKVGKYSVVIYAASYVTPFIDFNQITSDIQHSINKKCYVLFDLLLTNGNAFNRFAEAVFDGKEIRRDTIKVVEVNDHEQLKTLNMHYCGRAKELNESVLIPSERMKYARGSITHD